MKAIRFLCQDGGSLCCRCAILEDTEFGPQDGGQDIQQWAVIGAQLEEQDSEDIQCDNCGGSLFRFPFLDGDVAWEF